VSQFLRHDRKADPEGHNMSGKRAKLGLLRLEFSPRPIRYWMISKKIVVLDHKAREGQPRTAAKKQSDCDALSQVPRTIYELCCRRLRRLRQGLVAANRSYPSPISLMVSSGGSLGAIHRRRRGNRQDKRYEARTRRTSKRRQSPLLGLKLSNFLAQEIYVSEITHGDT
jgi:hypothetical protein